MRLGEALSRTWTEAAAEPILRAAHGDAGSRYHTTWFGDASRSGPLTSPGGTATWSGVMSGVEASPSSGSGAFVHGDSAIIVSGLAAGVEVSVDVAFINIVNEDTGAGIGDMVWRGLPLQGREFGTDNVLFDDGAGYFRDGSFGTATEGSIYGRLLRPRSRGSGRAVPPQRHRRRIRGQTQSLARLRLRTTRHARRLPFARTSRGRRTCRSLVPAVWKPASKTRLNCEDRHGSRSLGGLPDVARARRPGAVPEGYSFTDRGMRANRHGPGKTSNPRVRGSPRGCSRTVAGLAAPIRALRASGRGHAPSTAQGRDDPPDRTRSPDARAR